MLSSVFLLDSINIVSASTSYVCDGYSTGGAAAANIICRTNGNIIVTNTVIDIGQYSFITVNGIANTVGTAPLPMTANIVYTLPNNVPTSNTILFGLNSTGNVIIGLNAFQANQLVITANSYSAGKSVSVTAFNAVSSSTTNTVYGSWTFNAFVRDASGGATPLNTLTTNQIPLIQINPALVIPTPTTTSTSVVQLNQVTLSVNAPTTGTSPYTYQWYQENPGKNYVLLSGATSNSYAFGTSQFTAEGTHNFVLQITDSASTPVTVNSSTMSVVVNATSVGSSSGGSVSTSSGGTAYTTRATTTTTTVATTVSTTAQSTVPTTTPSTTVLPANTTVASTVATTASTSVPTTTIQPSPQPSSQNPLSGIINAIAKFFSSLFGH
ncbi:MAG: hypothetical protein KGH69_03105 [Candidatus Micrarchaeota archaeon]|nr:hypothetical protein [Candidatus Micrarchaeota archaeon]